MGGLPLDLWEHILGFGSIQSFGRLLRVCKDFHQLGDRKQRLFEKIAMREMQEKASSGCFYPSLLKRHCSPDVMLKFASSDAAKGIFFLSTRACPDIQPEYLDAVETLMLLPSMECVECYSNQTNIMEVIGRAGTKFKLDPRYGNMGVVSFLYPDARARRLKRESAACPPLSFVVSSLPAVEPRKKKPKIIVEKRRRSERLMKKQK